MLKNLDASQDEYTFIQENNLLDDSEEIIDEFTVACFF